MVQMKLLELNFMANCFVLYNNLITGTDDYRQRVKDITEFFSRNTMFDQFVTKDLTNKLIKLAQQGYHWAVVNALGHGVDDPAVYSDAVAKCCQNNWPLMCHIIARDKLYPGLDPQFFVIDLIKWTQVGQPAFESTVTTFQACTVTQSQNHVHDDYTPMWIHAGNETQTYVACEFGSVVIRDFLAAGYTVGNFDTELRSRKWNLYPNHNQTDLENLFFNHEVTYSTPPGIVRRIVAERDSLTSTIYVLNSEPVHPVPPLLTNHVVGVSAVGSKLCCC